MARLLTRSRVIADPPLARVLFSDTRMAIVWLVARLYIGYSWIEASTHKLSDPGWMQTGESLKAFWAKAAAIPAAPAKPQITFDWYRSFVQLLLDSGSYTWFAKVVAFGELAIGIALVAGAFVGVAATAGAFMNTNFLLAGTASTNPVLLLGAILLILAWKTAGFIGLDYVLLPLIGTPWRAPEEKRRALARTRAVAS